MNTESWERLAWRGDDEQPSDLHTSPTTRTRAGRPEVSRSTSTASHLTNGQGQCAVRRPCPGGLVVVVLGVDRDGWGGTERKGKRPSGPPRPACVVWWRGAEPGAARARRHPSRPRDAAHVATGAWLSVHARAHLHRFQCGQAAKRPRSPADADTWPGPHDGLASNGPLPSNVPSSRRAVPLHSALRFTLLLLLITSSPAPRHFTW